MVSSMCNNAIHPQYNMVTLETMGVDLKTLCRRRLASAKRKTRKHTKVMYTGGRRSSRNDECSDISSLTSLTREWRQYEEVVFVTLPMSWHGVT